MHQTLHWVIVIGVVRFLHGVGGVARTWEVEDVVRRVAKTVGIDEDVASSVWREAVKVHGFVHMHGDEIVVLSDRGREFVESGNMREVAREVRGRLALLFGVEEDPWLFIPNGGPDALTSRIGEIVERGDYELFDALLRYSHEARAVIFGELRRAFEELGLLRR